jgi:hypothetical protein
LFKLALGAVGILDILGTVLLAGAKGSEADFWAKVGVCDVFNLLAGLAVGCK